YTVQKTISWLTWLAKQMVQHSQTEFYIERMQVNWLSDSRSRFVCRMGSTLVSGLVGGLVGGLVVGLVGGLVVGLVVGLVGGLVVGLIVGLVFGLVDGLIVGLIVGLNYGGGAFIMHFVLRWFLWRAGSIPWNYPRFLDYAAGRILLHKAG